MPFSKRIVFVSLFLVLINVGWFGFKLASEERVKSPEISPHLVVRSGEEVTIKDGFEQGPVAARDGMELFTGAEITTSNQGAASIVLRQNVLRLAPDTQIVYLENHIDDPVGPWLTFRLKKGQVWVTARNSIQVNTDRTAIFWQNASGDYRYNDGQNRLIVADGMPLLRLGNGSGEVVTQVSIPLYGQADFSDDQIVAEYRTLQYSKLKKELKIRPVDFTIDPWLAQNLKEDEKWNAQHDAEIPGAGRAALGRFLDRFIVVQEKKNSLDQNEILSTLSAALQEEDPAILDDDLNRLTTLLSNASKEPTLMPVLRAQFDALDFSMLDSPSVRDVRDYLRDYFLAQGQTDLSVTYVSDFNRWLKRGDAKNALTELKKWVEYWQTRATKDHFLTLENEAHMIHSILLFDIKGATVDILAQVDRVGTLLLKASDNDPETLLSILQERIETSGLLVSVYRYPEAKNYLRKSYDTLKLDSKKAVGAAQQIFADRAHLILQRVDYAEKILKNAPKPIVEADFQAYLKDQEKNAQLAQVFRNFVSTPAASDITSPLTDSPEENANVISQTIRNFESAGIRVIPQDITPSTEDPSVLVIKNATLTAAIQNGRTLSFNAKYNVLSDAFYNIQIGDKRVRGGYLRKDLGRILSESMDTKKASSDPMNPEKLDSGILLLTPQQIQEENSQRTKILNRDVAIRYVMRDLNQAHLFISDPQQILPLDPDLIRFHIQDASLDSTGAPKTIDFDYDLEKKLLSAIQVKENPELTFGFYSLAEAAKQIDERVNNSSNE